MRRQEYERVNAGRGVPAAAYMGPGVYLELGRTYARLGDRQHALAEFERGRVQASDPDLLEELGDAYAAVGEYRKAAMAVVEALAIDSRRTQLGGKLVELYEKADPQGCSVSHQGNDRVLNVECPMVHGDICTASGNVAHQYERDGMASNAEYIRQVATRDLGCDATLLK